MTNTDPAAPRISYVRPAPLDYRRVTRSDFDGHVPRRVLRAGESINLSTGVISAPRPTPSIDYRKR